MPCASRTRRRSSSRPAARPSSTWSSTTSPWARRPTRVFERPTVLKRYIDGATASSSSRSGAEKRPDWLETVTVSFPSAAAPTNCARRRRPPGVGRQPRVPRSQPLAGAAADVDHPDELRVDLDPQPGVAYSHIQDVAEAVHHVLDEHGLVGFPKTSGSRASTSTYASSPASPSPRFGGAPWPSPARHREMPTVATAKWWKEERGDRVFIDYNQNARDRTVASAYSVRANPEGVSRARSRGRARGSRPGRPHHRHRARALRAGRRPSAAIDEHAYSLDPLLELARRDEAEGLGDEPWPPHFPKMAGEGARVRRAAPARSPDVTSRRSGYAPKTALSSSGATASSWS